jgi:flagellar FliJ protein
MKKFKYRLQPLLKVREHIEKEKQKEHAAALLKVHNQQQSLQKITSAQDKTLNEQRRELTGSLSVAEMLVYTRHFLKLKRDLLAERELLKVLQKDAHEKRNELVKASKERKIYQKHKERLQWRHEKETTLQTAKESDEIALNTFRRKRG